jgi:hypothetical protein
MARAGQAACWRASWSNSSLPAGVREDDVESRCGLRNMFGQHIQNVERHISELREHKANVEIATGHRAVVQDILMTGCINSSVLETVMDVAPATFRHRFFRSLSIRVANRDSPSCNLDTPQYRPIVFAVSTLCFYTISVTDVLIAPVNGER